MYKFVFVYNPTTDEIKNMYIFNGRETGLDLCVRHLSATINVKEEIILGKSIAGNYYQLYLEKYSGGSQYIREDAASIKKFMKPAHISVVAAKYITRNHLWDEIKD